MNTFFPTLFLVVLALAVTGLFLAQEARAATREFVFVVSDPADEELASSAGFDGYTVYCPLTMEAEGARIVFVLDYNPSFCHRDLDVDALLDATAEKGGVLVLGLNTIRTSIREPQLLGLPWRIGSGPHDTEIVPTGELRDAGAPVIRGYNASKYLWSTLETMPVSWKPIAYFGDGSPAIVEASYGRGRVILLLFNPVWPHVEGEDGYSQLAKALLAYAENGPETMLPLIAVVAAAAATASATYNWLRREVEHLVHVAAKHSYALILLVYRVGPDDALGNEVRRRIYELAVEEGYLTVAKVRRLTGLSRSSLLWHISVLERSGLLESVNVLGVQVYYVKGRRDEAVKRFLLESRQRRLILDAIRNKGKTTITSLAKELGLSKSTVKHHVDVLAEYGLVRQVGGKLVVVEGDDEG